MSSQLQALTNAGIKIEDVVGPPDFTKLSLDSSNMVEMVTAGYGADTGFGRILALTAGTPNVVQFITLDNFLNTSKRHTLFGRYAGMRFIANPTVATATSSACKFFFQHPQSNTGTNSLINTSGGQLIYILQGGQAAEDGTLPTHYAGLLISVTSAETKISAVAGGSGSTNALKLQFHSIVAFQIDSAIKPITDGSGDLGASAKRFASTYSKSFIGGGATGSHTHTFGSGNAGTDDNNFVFQINGSTKWIVKFADNGVPVFDITDANSYPVVQIKQTTPAGASVENCLVVNAGLIVTQQQADDGQTFADMTITGGIGFDLDSTVGGPGQNVGLIGGRGGADSAFFSNGGVGGDAYLYGGEGGDGASGGDAIVRGGSGGTGASAGSAILRSYSGDFELVVNDLGVYCGGNINFADGALFYSPAWNPKSGASVSVTIAESGSVIACSHGSLCTLSLPGAETGKRFTLIAMSSSGLKIQANGSNTMILNGVVSTPTSGYLQLNQYANITLVGISSTQWMVISAQGVITII